MEGSNVVVNYILKSILVILFIIYSFYTVIGLIFMHGVERKPSETTTCDFIERIDGRLYCMAEMQSEDENIRVIRDIEE